MEDIWSVDKLTLFLAFLLPGFVSLQVYRLFIAGDDADLVKKLPTLIAYSTLHYAAVGWMFLVFRSIPLTYRAYIIVLVIPILWPFVILLFRDWRRWLPIFTSFPTLINTMLKPEAKPWDRVFTNDQFVRITLKDGGVVGGFLAKGSSVSTYPSDEQIYVKNAHKIDQETGIFGERIPSTSLLVNGDEIKLVELVEFDPSAELKSEKEQNHGTST